MILQDALPGSKRFFKPLGLGPRALGLAVRCVAAFALRCGRMSAAQAAGAVRSAPRHRAQIVRFLGRKYWRTLRVTDVPAGGVALGRDGPRAVGPDPGPDAVQPTGHEGGEHL